MNIEKSITGLTIETVEMTEVDGMGQGAVLQFMLLPKGSSGHQEKEIRTCLGDIYVIVNALRDYANLLERAAITQELTEVHGAIFHLHAARCRKIAGKYASAIGYNYDAALKRCRKRRARVRQNSDTGMDGLEALVHKRHREQIEKEKEQVK